MAEMFPKPLSVSPSVSYRDSHVHKGRNKKCFGCTQIMAGREEKLLPHFTTRKQASPILSPMQNCTEALL